MVLVSTCFGPSPALLFCMTQYAINLGKLADMSSVPTFVSSYSTWLYNGDDSNVRGYFIQKNSPASELSAGYRPE